MFKNLAENSNFLNTISLQPDYVNLWYFKLRHLFDLGEIIVWNVKGWITSGYKYIEIQIRICDLRPNLKNLNRFAEPPKTGSNWAPALISKHWIQWQVEPTIFKARFKFWDAAQIFLIRSPSSVSLSCLIKIF